MAEQLSYDVTARDRGATRTLGAVDKAMRELGEHTQKLDKDTGKLADAQLRVRQSMLGVKQAEDGLHAARDKLRKVTADSNSTEAARRKAVLGVEQAELRQAKSLRGVQSAGESAARTARGIAAAQKETESSTQRASLAQRIFGRDLKASAVAQGANEKATQRATIAQRLFGRESKAAADGSARSYVGLRKTMGGVSVGFGSIFKGMAVGVPVAGALGVGLLALGKRVWDTASNIELMDQKARIVFGASFPQVEAWAGRVAGGFGKTRRETIALATGFADMLVPMGFTRDRAASMAQRFAQMAPILSRWSAGTVSVEQASEALTGALTGEYDTLQRLGIPISAAQVDAELLRKGQDKLTGSARAQASAVAALDIVYRGSTDAQKAFGNGQTGLAGKAAQSKARLMEVRDAIIAALIPALSKLGLWFLNHQDDIINFGFQAAASIIHFGKFAGHAFGDILIGVGKISGGLADLLGASNTTWVGISRGAALALGIINPSAGRAATAAISSFERLRTGAADKLRAIETKATAAGTTLKTQVTKGADAAGKKLEEVRRKALNIPNKTLTRLDVEDREANRRIAATKKALQDPNLTKTRKAKLEADLAKWEAQKKQIARDKANLAKAVYVPAGARAVPSGVRVVRQKDASGAIIGIRFGQLGARAAGGPGGAIHGPGAGRSDTAGVFRLSNNEHVWTEREVIGAGGHRNVEVLRKKAAAGQLPGLAFGGPATDMDGARTRAHMRSGLQVAADSGLKAAIQAAVHSALKSEMTGGGPFNAGLAGAVSFARRQAGKPYLWGGVGPGGYDCSGFMSALVNVAQGRNPYQRRFATGSLPAGLFNPGLGGAFRIGWFTGNPGHTAGTINGVNVESRGGDGVVVGPGARGATAGMFTRRGSLKGFAVGGPVLPGDPPWDVLSRRGKHYMPDALRHISMAGGGTIREPVLGIGRSGRTYSFGERGPETVTPGAGTTINVYLSGVVGNDQAVVGKIRQGLREALRAEGRPVTV